MFRLIELRVQGLGFKKGFYFRVISCHRFLVAVFMSFDECAQVSTMMAVDVAYCLGAQYTLGTTPYRTEHG